MTTGPSTPEAAGPFAHDVQWVKKQAALELARRIVDDDQIPDTLSVKILARALLGGGAVIAELSERLSAAGQETIKGKWIVTSGVETEHSSLGEVLNEVSQYLREGVEYVSIRAEGQEGGTKT